MATNLQEYKKKRKFDDTPEPKGKVSKSKGAHRFVIQKHDASRLHYDFRLEMEGVLKSWAVPKGPSLNPADKRLAMMVEDHPMEYGKFEGIIPKGNYGAGTVMVWDEGTYHALNAEGKAANEKELLKGLKSGNLKFIMEGQKLKGEFALVRIKGNENKGNEWLLIKKKDEFASTDDITKKDKSILSGRTLGKIEMESGEGDTVWHSNREEKQESQTPSGKSAKPKTDKGETAAFPHEIKPMLATLVNESFDSKDWLFEIKWDGYRAIAEVEKGEVKLYSRNNLPFNAQFPEIASELKDLGSDAVLDGEIVALDENGLASFQLIQNYKKSHKGNIVFYVFDILYYNGRDLQNLSLLDRKEILKEILPDSEKIKYNDHILEQGKSFYQVSEEKQLEGIIAKKINSTYDAGGRSKEWLKIKTHKRQEAVIAGFTNPRGGRKFFGALVLGVYKNNKLVYIGHTGGGFNDVSLKEVYKNLKEIVQEECPFEEVPKTNTPVTWVKPELMCEVKFHEWTNDGHMRVPIFLGMRIDKDPKEIIRENEKPLETIIKPKEKKTSSKKKEETKAKKKTPVSEKAKKFSIENAKVELNADETEATVSINKKILKFSNLKKIYWEEKGYTKQDLFEYYDKISDVILPYLKDRPENLRRNPNGYNGKSFFQKDMPDTLPDWIETVEIFSDSNSEYLNYMICQDKASLLYMANLGCIEINPWLSRKESLDKPDYIVIDLDPQDVTFEDVIEVALAVKAVLDKGNIKSFPKTSGSRGLHIYIPLEAKYNYDQARQFAELIAMLTNQLVPKITSLERSPAKRRNKIYLDYLQNRKGQTLAAPYCVRPKINATVSTPLKWEEVKTGLTPLDFDIITIFDRLKTHGDIFLDVMGKGNNIPDSIEKLKK